MPQITNEDIACPFKRDDPKSVIFDYLKTSPKRNGIATELTPILHEAGFSDIIEKSIPPRVSGTISSLKLFGIVVWYVDTPDDLVSIPHGKVFLILSDEEAELRGILNRE